MELKWLEDYIALVETRNFSAAAQRRNVSQPAFSRRIRALENWLDVELVDRARKPLRFRPIARDNEAAFRNLLKRVYEFRSQIKSEVSNTSRMTVAAQHSLTASILPSILDRVNTLLPHRKYRVRSENKDVCVTLLARGEADVLILYETGTTMASIAGHVAVKRVIGHDELVLVATPQLALSIRKALQKTASSASVSKYEVPVLLYPSESFFGQAIWEEAMPELKRKHDVAIQCVSAFAFGQRAMAEAGLGAAWLPGALAQDAVAKGRLVIMNDVVAAIQVEIVAYISKISNNPDVSFLLKGLADQ